MIPRNLFSLAVIVLLSISGCSIDYGAALTDEDISVDIPNTIIEGLTYVSVRQGNPVIEIKAQKALAFDGKKETHLEGVEFYEYNGNGEISAEGSGDFGVYYQDTENVDMKGSIRLYSHTEEAGIQAGFLAWNKDKKELKGNPDDFVRLEQDDGSYIQGKDFMGKMGEKAFLFGSSSTGTLVVTDEEKENENEQE